MIVILILITTECFPAQKYLWKNAVCVTEINVPEINTQTWVSNFLSSPLVSLREMLSDFLQCSVSVWDAILRLLLHFSESFLEGVWLKTWIPAKICASTGRDNLPVSSTLKQEDFVIRISTAVGECTQRVGRLVFKTREQFMQTWVNK